MLSVFFFLLLIILYFIVVLGYLVDSKDRSWWTYCIAAIWPIYIATLAVIDAVVMIIPALIAGMNELKKYGPSFISQKNDKKESSSNGDTTVL